MGRLLIMWLRAGDLIDRQTRPKLLCLFLDRPQGSQIVGVVLPGVVGVVVAPIFTLFLLSGAVAILLHEPSRDPASPIVYWFAKLLAASTVASLTIPLWWRMHELTRQGRPMASFLMRRLRARAQ